MVQPLSNTDVLRKRVSRGGVVPRMGHKVLMGHPLSLQHWMAVLLCSEKRPVRKGQILPCTDVRTVKYPSCGRNIVQQEAKSRKDQRNYGVARAYLSLRVFHLVDDLAGIATGELIGVSQLNKEAEEKRCRI
jgi:hypothetical protein